MQEQCPNVGHMSLTVPVGMPGRCTHLLELQNEHPAGHSRRRHDRRVKPSMCQVFQTGRSAESLRRGLSEFGREKHLMASTCTGVRR